MKKENESLKNLLEQKKDVQQQKIASGAHGKGEETPLKDTDRPNVKSNFEKEKRLQKQPTDRTTGERDSLNNEYKILKEKPGQEYFQKFQEKFYNEPDILNAKELQKISMEAGKDLETNFFEGYGNIIQEAVESGKLVPAGTYIMTKPDMILIPIRISIDFNERKIKMSLWEKKPQSHI